MQPSTQQRTLPLTALALCIVAVIAVLLPAAVSARSSLFDRHNVASVADAAPSRSQLFSSAAASLSVPSMCPETVSVPDPSAPEAPEGYTFLSKPVIRPVYANASWYMIDVLHSNSAVWLPGHIICKYTACAKYGCPTIALLSNATYVNPAKPDGASWGNYRSINDTLICAPADHDVSNCLFS